MQRPASEPRRWDAVIVGSGPNGLVAGLWLARRGWRVLIVERAEQPGGGLRTDEDLLPGCRHDHCATVFPLAVASPVLRSLGLVDVVEWISSPAAVAHPFDDGTVVLLWPELDRTCRELGPDGGRYRALLRPWVEGGPATIGALLSPLPGVVRSPELPRPSWSGMLRIAWTGLRSARWLVAQLSTREGQALLAGLAAHSTLPLEWAPSAAYALVLAACAHTVGWPLVRGGAARLIEWFVAQLDQAGAAIRCSTMVHSLAALPESQVLLLDVAPRTALALAGHRWPRWYRRRLERYRHGPGVFKLDWVVREGIPWRNPQCDWAATVHLGGSAEEIAAAERAVARGTMPERPFVIVVQPSWFDPTRAPRGLAVVWGYCHVPHGWRGDATDAIENQIERFAPGFRARIVTRRAWSPEALEHRNPNLVGGDLSGGWPTLGQLVGRPSWYPWPPYRTPDPAIFLCSAATPPGGGVHGMCGYWAARLADRRLRRVARIHRVDRRRTAP